MVHPAYPFVIAALSGVLLLLMLEALSLWREARPTDRLLFILLVSAVFAAAVFYTRHTALRGGFPNQHDFEFLSAMPFDAGLRNKELSPLALFSVADVVSARSLEGIQILQKGLWLVSSLLLYGSLSAAGVGCCAAAAAAGLFFFNFLSVICSYSFSTANANIFFVMAAIYALAAFRFGEKRILRHIALFLLASFLVFTGRFELFPPMLLGLAAALCFGGFAKVSRLAEGDRNSRIAVGSLAALFAISCLVWGYEIAVMDSSIPRDLPIWRAAPNLLSNINYQLGIENLTAALGFPAALCWPLLVLLLAGLAIRAYFCPVKRRDFLFWAAWLGPWIFYAGLVFLPCSNYPLHQVRHHLYFFIPVPLLVGVSLSGCVPNFGKRNTAVVQAAFVAAGLFLYFYLNLRHVNACRAELRTNDREWQFLLEARRGWDKSCKAIYPWHDSLSHRDLLKKYFPYADSGDLSGAGCVLLYRSPVEQVFTGAADKWEAPFVGVERDIVKTGYSVPVTTTSFVHRFHTDWRAEAGGNCPVSESTAPVKIEIGFYRMPESIRERIRAGLRRATLDPSAEILKTKRRPPPVREELHSRAPASPLPSGYEPGRDTATDLRAALALAASQRKRVLVLVGGDWCSWCSIMSRFFADNPDVSAAKEAGFVTLKIFHNPARPPLPAAIAKFPQISGYPHIYVLETDGSLLVSQDTTRLEYGQGYDHDKFLAFLNLWSMR